MEGKDFCCYEFGEFRLDARRRALSKNGEKVPLSARNFDLLFFMVENGGRILEHDELLDKVWVGTFVEQSSLKKGISALRQILEETAETEFIKTIPRRGYSFVSPVRVVPEEGALVYVRETESEIIVEEYEETDDPDDGFHAPEKIIEITPTSAKALPSAELRKSGFVSVLFGFSRLIIFSAAGIAVIVLAFFALKPYFAKAGESQFSIENVRITRITSSGNIGVATISADGSYLLYPATENAGTSLWLRQMSTSSTSRLTPPVSGGFWGFAIAPDNSYIYYILNNVAEPQKSGFYKIPLLGGESQRIAENVGTFAISPDGKRIVLVRGDEGIHIFTVNTEGDDAHEVKVLPLDSALWGISWTPDGAALLCTIRKTINNKPLFSIVELTPENGKETVILPAQEKFIFGAVWLPDKNAILVTEREPNADIRQIWQYFPSSQEWRRLTNDNNSYSYAALTRDGKNIVTNQLSRLVAIWITDDVSITPQKPETKSLLGRSDNFRQITAGVSNFDRIGWLADGHLIYSATENGKETIFSIGSDGTNARQITNGEDGIWIFPNAAGNGQSISFISTRGGARQVWRIDADGKNPTKMTDTKSPVSSARILRDNSTVIYDTEQAGINVLFRQTADGQTTQLTSAPTGSFAVSPDEKLLAAETLDKNTDKFRIELISLEDGKTIKTFDFSVNRQISFTPDGKNLAYDVFHNNISQIMVQPIAGGEPFALINFQSDQIFSFDWSADGKHLAVIRGKQLTDAVLIKANTR
jgi:DNA-binding winged helix-turn-helix (wHTH) protein/Tol biopolymer transport system component